MRYVVSVLHSGGHGPDNYVALSTTDLVQAIDTAINIESFGYRIGGEMSAMVLKMKDGWVYRKPSSHDDPDPDFLLFYNFRPTKWNDPMEQKWVSQDAEREYHKLKQEQLATT